MQSASEVRLLNQSSVVREAEDWSGRGHSALFAFHLHYFDDLTATRADERVEWHRELIDRWLREHPPTAGVGWHAYPTSRRIVNWIKWAWRGHAMKKTWLDSLALQARWLRRRLEYHLLANHILANAKALVFAGVFFEGREAEEWLAKGLAILERELPEQILPDGGHFERSPMYHSIVLEDVLDLVNLLESSPELSYSKAAGIAARSRSYSALMMRFLKGMCHPDGGISFFNDAALGMAAKPSALIEYAARLGIEVPPDPGDGITHFPDTGYVRYQDGALVALLDVAPVGPDYQPGHAHADTLSFELSLFGQRVFVNSGTSTYEVSEERHRQRSTKAHNTVEIDGENSSEVWKSFRVARRAYPRGLNIEEMPKDVRVSCEHNGYERLRGRPVHRREWHFSAGELLVVEHVQGKARLPGGFRSRLKAAPTWDCVASYHLHPDIEVAHGEEKDTIFLRMPGNQAVRFSCLGGWAEVEDCTWHPEFGLSIPNKVIRCRFDERLECRLRWSDD